MTEESLFTGALEKTPGPDRQHFLDEACGADEPMRRRIENLLAAHEAGRGLLDNITAGTDLVSSLTLLGTSAAPSLSIGTLIAGRYRLLELIGEGGMGVVYVAEQIEPVRRKVALKIIKPGMDSHARPRALRHGASGPGDHGPPAHRPRARRRRHRSGPALLRDGMSQGPPITEYCDSVRMPIRATVGTLRDRLPSRPARASEGDHPPRPLKPSNILVASTTTSRLSKVIDFGVAKVIDQPLDRANASTPVSQYSWARRCT